MEDKERPWVKYYNPEQTRDTIDYPDISVYEIVRRVAANLPDKVAYEFQGKNTDYKTFMKKVDHAAACLYKMGVRKGDTFVICMPNCPQAIHVFYAVIKCGGIATLIHPLSAKKEIEEYLQISEAKYALTLDAFCNNFIAVKENTKLEKLIVASIKDELSFFKSIGFSLTLGRKIPKHPKLDYIYEWKDFLALSDSDDMPEVENTGKDPSVILFSGGTTGTPKGIVLSNLNMNATAYGTLAVSGCLPCHIDEAVQHGIKKYLETRDYVVLSVMPMFHGFGLGIGIHTFFVIGGKCILVPTFTPDSFAKLVVTKRPNFIAGVPTLYEKMISSDVMKNADLSCLDGIFVGGDALSIETRERVDGFLKSHNAKTILREGYGLTESVTATCLTPVDYCRPGGIGVPFPDVLFKIVKIGTEESLPYGEEGEICISGPNIMVGYYNNPEETAQT
ncbi:MAG: AMP-binding protein, partial [Candidatus Methanomethylophilaceae archaeon]|nr:AMP-binding protein [Candidatus Methanomethylophilaceae archaeon]